MKILGIETSCDETAAAVVENGTKILSNVVASSVELHKKTGGIIPEVAAREQIKCILPVINEAVQSAKCKPSSRAQVEGVQSLDSIAVTIGPGLIGSLLVGVETAKTLAYVWKKPIVPVNHLQAHLYANWLVPENKQQTTNNKVPEFPAVGLVVSGGHTDLVLIKGYGKIKWLGGTRDDAAGECFDKCARILGLSYPGGPAIAAEAVKLDASRYTLAPKLPRPMINEDNLDFSFSGLKTAVLRGAQDKSSKQKQTILSCEIQEAICDVLVAKTLRATEKYKVKSILLAGGVAANQRLREKMQSAISHMPYALFIPPPSLCTDNATYVASCGYFNYHPVPWQKINVKPNLGIADPFLDKN